MYFYHFFRALSTVKCSTTFPSDQKFVCEFPWKTFHLRCFILKPSVTHLNEATYSKVYYATVKNLRKELTNSLNNY